MIRNMTLSILTAASLLLITSVGCSIEGWDYTYEHHRIGVGYDGGLDFTLVEPDGTIEPRMDHATVVFDNKIWVFGGYNPNARGDRDCYLEDIWYTEDGYIWVNVTMDAPWQGRRGHEVVVFDADRDGEDELYLIGGFRAYREQGITYGGAVNDVWRSTDGLSWERIKDHSYRTTATHPTSAAEDVRGADIYDPADDIDWYPRLNHTVLIYDADDDGMEELCLIGGFAKERIPYLNDHASDETRKYFADIWVSEDGITWTQSEPMYVNEDHADIYGRYTAGRASFASFIHEDEIYIVGGTSWFTFQENGEGFVVPGWDQVWKGAPGNWVSTGLYHKEYSERRNHEIVKYRGSYWMLPGSNPAAIQWYHDMDSIWKIGGAPLVFERDGSFRTGSPMFGIANYTAEVFTPVIGENAGEEAIYVLFGDGDGGVRNTSWIITEKETEAAE